MIKEILIILVLFCVCALSSNAVIIDQGINFTPSLSNVTYTAGQNITGKTDIMVNETCLMIDNSILCNQSSTPITIQLNQSISLDFGPVGISIFRVEGCGPQIINSSALPEGQNSSHGIDYICNDGTLSVDISVSLSGIPNSTWQIYSSNKSTSQNLINLTNNPTSWKKIYDDLNAAECTYLWYNFTCINVTRNIGVYQFYNFT